MNASIVTRFAPSPTGLLHVGHAFSALFAYESAKQQGGRFVLRIEDIDFTRCRPDAEKAMIEDLRWLGLTWDTPVRRQSEHVAEYEKAAKQLRDRGLLYPCFCTRKDIQHEIDAAGGAPHGPEGPLYSGICRDLSDTERQARISAGQPFALRLNIARSMAEVSGSLEWFDLTKGSQTASPECLGDVVLVRKDIGCSYHLAVVFDDAVQGITQVTRGMDLFEATHLQRLLQELLSLPVPQYHHHRLIYDDAGRRLAKRHEAETLQSLRSRGITARQIRNQLGFED